MPEDRHLLRSCRNVCDVKASVLKVMTDAGIRTIDVFSFLADEVGGVENIGFTRMDAWNLQDHVWLQDLYRIRNKWSTAFNKDCFSMDILSTQRSESTNNVCHGISKPQVL
ncbi:Protein FAR1-RELATED SEQUENCE 5 [Dendrobium catenatum]|uniref:Protein FAR1-RELATED SEQUENCE 5 n=1 Tax=Dendrobium catenatum TaxID=906689 RepID=A0A2I0WNT1_9ASPA|nr:Protein FAR1-RELATED SEQUENCE 5 [Dendrobium catenatum]